jgi:hypothetical protein
MPRLIDEDLVEFTPKNQMNGCGSKFDGKLIPDWIGDVCLTKACDIHDAQYYWKRPKQIADKCFLKNMLLLNDCYSTSKIAKFARIPIIYSYYYAVRFFGPKY